MSHATICQSVQNKEITSIIDHGLSSENQGGEDKYHENMNDILSVQHTETESIIGQEIGVENQDETNDESLATINLLHSVTDKAQSTIGEECVPEISVKSQKESEENQGNDYEIKNYFLPCSYSSNHILIIYSASLLVEHHIASQSVLKGPSPLTKQESIHGINKSNNTYVSTENKSKIIFLLQIYIMFIDTTHLVCIS